MPRRALDNPIVSVVLGILLEGPAYPYQLLVEAEKRSDHHAAAVSRGTLYNAVTALAEQGWIVEEEVQRSGNRPERTVYAITDAGRAELVRRLDAEIRNPEREFSRFFGAVTHLGALGAEGAAAALGERARRLRERIADDEQRLTEALEVAPRLYVIEAEYALCTARAELGWVEAVVADIHSGALTWPDAGSTDRAEVAP